MSTTSTIAAAQPSLLDEARPLAARHALITGAGRGIGAAIAHELARLGARLTLTGRTAATLDARQAEIAAAHRVEVRRHVADVADETAIAAAFARAADDLGPVEILVNNAGIAPGAAIQKTDLALWQRVMEVNATGAFLCIREVLPGMRERAFGRIVTVASTAGLVGYRYTAAYCASKHAVVGLTRALALELARTGITVNAVCPGYTETDIVRDAVRNIVAKTGRSEDEALAELTRSNPQGRIVEADEVARVVGWLCLPAAGGITGQAIAVDGGETAG